jgi:hypothetical protein
MNRAWWSGAAVAAAMGVAGCGGGGGSGSGATPLPQEAPRVVITQTNGSRLGAEALSSTGAGDVGSSVANLIGVQVDAAGGRPAPWRLLVDATRKALDLPLPKLVVGAAVNLSTTCANGGSVSVQGTVADPNRDSSGDSLTVSFSNCVEGTNRTTGSITLRLAQVDATETFYAIDLVATGFTTSTGVLGERLDGSLRLTLDSRQASNEIVEVTAPVLTLQQLVNNVVRTSRSLIAFDYDLNITNATGVATETIAFTATGSFPVLGDVSFIVSTAAPIVSTSIFDDRPSSGSIVITGAANRSVTVTVVSGGARFDVDRTGDAAIDDSTTLTWSEIDALVGV